MTNRAVIHLVVIIALNNDALLWSHTSMKDRIPENETSIPFTQYGSLMNLFPLCEYVRLRYN